MGQGFGSSLAGQFWLKVYHEFAIKVAESVVLTGAGGSVLGCLTHMAGKLMLAVAGGLSSSPRGPLCETA